MRNLLITTFGEYNHVKSWLNGNRNFDVALINYDFHEHSGKLVGDCVYLDSFATFKYPGIYEVLWSEPRLLKYDYYFMPDEDILLSCGDINTLFDKARTLNLDICCPSIKNSSESFPSWDCFVHIDAMDFVATKFIEVMCPVFSKHALSKCLDTFQKSQSGWGLDLVWPKLVHNNGSNIGVIHSVVAKHTRKIAGGTLYQDLQRQRIQPAGEKRKLMQEYGVNSSILEGLTNQYVNQK